MKNRMLGFNIVALGVLCGAMLILPTVFQKVREAQTLHLDAAGPGQTLFGTLNRGGDAARTNDPYRTVRALMARTQADPTAGGTTIGTTPSGGLVLFTGNMDLTPDQRLALLRQADTLRPAGLPEPATLEIAGAPTTDE